MNQTKDLTKPTVKKNLHQALEAGPTPQRLGVQVAVFWVVTY